MVGSLIEALLISMEEDEECVYDHTLIDGSNAQSGDKGKMWCWRTQFKHVQECCHRDGIDVVVNQQ